VTESHLVCTKCAGVNRVPAGRSPLKAKCGKCGARLFEGRPDDVNGNIFEAVLARSTVPVLVDVWAPWCGPCRMMAPAFEAAARELEPGVRLIKLNSDAEQATAARLGIRGIPTMILFHSGREISRQSGALTTSQIVKWFQAHVPELQ
jgi:thioredoxin 2